MKHSLFILLLFSIGFTQDIGNIFSQETSDSENKSINQIFEEDGEIVFRKLEHEALIESLQAGNAVLSLGGGTPCYYNNLELINESSTSFYLRGSINTLVERIQIYKSDRPLVKNLSSGELKEYVAKHLFERKDFYEKAHHAIDVDNKSFEEIVDEIIKKIQNNITTL